MSPPSAGPRAAAPPGTPPVLVLAWGNEARGDDALGPELGRRAQAWLAARGPAAGAQIEVLIEQQLAAEHVMDLPGRQELLFIDAVARPGPAPQWHRVALPARAPAIGHQASPELLLWLAHAHLGLAPPPATLLAVPGLAFDLGAALSGPAAAALEQAWAGLQTWLAQRLQDNAGPST